MEYCFGLSFNNNNERKILPKTAGNYMNNFNKLFYTICFAFLLGTETSAQMKSFYNIVDFGAKGDGLALNTRAIQDAVDKCSEEGGTVIIPPGKFLTGSIELKNNVDIYIQNGAEILGSTNISDYVERKPKFDSYNDVFLKHSLFYAESVENISVRGEGIINGQGETYKVSTRIKPDRYKNRPFVFRFVECKNIRIENLTMMNSAMWMQQYLACEDLFISGIKVYNHANQNNDMMDIDGCKNVVISGCLGDTDDDGITLKSTSPRITENVTITNCVLSSHCNAFKFGTESTGGFKNITVSNLVIKPSSRETTIYGLPKGTSGITLATVDGGIVENINISNVIMDGPEVPIFLRLGNRARKFKEDIHEPGIGIFKNVLISNVIAVNAGKTGCSITGIPGNYISNVTLRNISISFAGGGKNTHEIKNVPELENQYPEGTMWNELPAYGFFIRHVNNLKISDIELSSENKDERSAIIMEDVSEIKIDGLTTKIRNDKVSAIAVSLGKNIIISNSSVAGNAESFVRVIDRETKNVFLYNNDTRNSKKIINQKMANQVKVISNINR